jgi:hypothetical protein
MVRQQQRAVRIDTRCGPALFLIADLPFITYVHHTKPTSNGHEVSAHSRPRIVTRSERVGSSAFDKVDREPR